MERGKARRRMGEAGYRVLAVTLFGKLEVARYPTLEQAEHKARELNEWAERNPRGYAEYVVRPVEERRETK